MDLTITINESGNLVLTMDKESREELKEALEEKGFWSAFGEMMESFSANGSYEPFDAGDANPFVGLSSAPCIAEEMSMTDDGERRIEGRFWAFVNYMLECPLETLAETGKVEFQYPGEKD